MTLLPARKSLTPTGDPNTYYNKGETDALLSGKASTDLTNLSSTGQMIIDSQNGTISNCILDIPQNLKLEFSNGTVTLKAGSIITCTGSTYSTVTTTQDVTWSSSTQANVKQYLFITAYGFAVGLYGRCNINKVGSGDTLPANGSTYLTFYNTTDKVIYQWNPDTSQWESTTTCYPLGIVEIDSQGAITGFAKDSNGNDMIFNGAGFIGHHAVIYPNVKALYANRFNADGSLASGFITNNSLVILEMATGQAYTGYNRCIGLSDSSTDGIWKWRGYKEVDTPSDLTTQDYMRQYVKSTNKIEIYAGSSYLSDAQGYYRSVKFIEYNYDGSTVTDFTIRQPVRTATVEMLKDKQNDLTTVSGYDATKTQTLKNVSGVLTWVDD